MQTRFSFSFLVVIAGALLFWACASSAPKGPTKASMSEDHYLQLDAGKSAELKLQVPDSEGPLEPIVVTFAASAPIAWNVQHKPYGDMEVAVEGHAAAQVIRHTPNEAGPVSLAWVNQSDGPVRATVRVTKLPAGTKGVWRNLK